MIKLLPPVKKVRLYGAWVVDIKSLKDLGRAIEQSGQPFGVNWHPDPNFYPSLGLVGHNGLDIPFPRGTEVYATHDGVVSYAQLDWTGGIGTIVNAPGYKTIYWHHLENKVKVGDEVKAGDLLALGNNTGLSTGDHLHFGLKLLDNSNNVLNRDNGYDGAVDPWPYMIWYDQHMQGELWRADKDVYRIREKDGVKYKDQFINGEAFTILDGRWSEIQQKTQAELDAVQDGSVLIVVNQE